ncbi:hypothetical protein ABHV46_10980 [Asaia sp. BMEF1]|uniref:hypothetical protein n=1 Tax=Asaia sp. BMEF1 TaxID=3155932 RepID=UPI003F66EABC
MEQRQVDASLLTDVCQELQATNEMLGQHERRLRRDGMREEADRVFWKMRSNVELREAVQEAAQ